MIFFGLILLLVPMLFAYFNALWCGMKQSYPREYVEDMKEMWDNMGKVVGLWETVEENQVEETKNLWETSFDEPYERAGGGIAVGMEKAVLPNPPIYWEVSDVDVNITKYKSITPRFLLEVIIMPLPSIISLQQFFDAQGPFSKIKKHVVHSFENFHTFSAIFLMKMPLENCNVK